MSGPEYVPVFEILEQSNLIYSHREQASAGCWGGGERLQMGTEDILGAGDHLHLGGNGD